MSEAVLGEIRIFAGNYAPDGWHLCDGSLLPIQQNMPLYSLIGTTFGGDGINNFGIPDLRGRLPVGQGQGTNLTNRVIGQVGGASTAQITQANMPPHNHIFYVSGVAATSDTPTQNAVLAVPPQPPGGTVFAYTDGAVAQANKVQMDPTMVDTAPGGSNPHDNVMPYVAMSYWIALQGIYPDRP